MSSKTPSQRGMASKRKGKVGERELAAFLTEHGYPCHRTAQHRGKEGGEGDCICPRIAPIHIECKRAERGRMEDWLEQARRDAGAGRLGGVFHRKNGHRWSVTFDLAEFLQLGSMMGWFK